MFHIKEMIKTDKWRVVSDEDMVLKAAIKKAISLLFGVSRNTRIKAISNVRRRKEYYLLTIISIF
ncbi:MAG TPA: hypothetical protein VGI04_04165 [Neobacillus sp.]